MIQGCFATATTRVRILSTFARIDSDQYDFARLSYRQVSMRIREWSVASIRVFEPALCCNTGVCGEDVDQALVDFTADLDHLKQQGVDIDRHNLANDPLVFAQNPVVRNFLTTTGSEGLPLVLVDDVTVLTGRYPTRAMLTRYAGLAAIEPVTLDLATTDSQGCCGGSTSTCC